MKLNNAHTRDFLLSWAHDAGFLCDGLDTLLAELNGRAVSLSAPLTYEACLNLTDEELQRFYEEFGIVKFYPELSHERKAWLLWRQAMEWRWLGTPQTIEDLCRYIMDQTEVELHITDSLAFDANGNLVHPELLNAFDAELSVLSPDLPESTLNRIYDNIIRFKNDRTELRGFSFIFELEGGDLDSTIAYTDGGNYEVFYDNLDCVQEPTRRTGYLNANVDSSATFSAKSRDVSIYSASDTYLNLDSASARYEVLRCYETSQDIVGFRPNGIYLSRFNSTNPQLRAVLTNFSNTAYTVQRFDYRKIESISYTFTSALVNGFLTFTITLQGITGSGYVTLYGYCRGNAVSECLFLDHERIRYTNGSFTLTTTITAETPADAYLNITNLQPDN